MTTTLSVIYKFHPDEWAQILEALPKSGKYVLALRDHVRRMLSEYQRLQGRLGRVYQPPPSLSGEPGTVKEFPELGMWYQNFHGQILFVKASELKKHPRENLFNFLKVMKRFGEAIKFHDALKSEIQRRDIQVKKEQEKKGAGASKKR